MPAKLWSRHNNTLSCLKEVAVRFVNTLSVPVSRNHYFYFHNINFGVYRAISPTGLIKWAAKIVVETIPHIAGKAYLSKCKSVYVAYEL